MRAPGGGGSAPIFFLEEEEGSALFSFLGNSKTTRIKDRSMVLSTSLIYPQLSIYKGHFFHSKNIFPYGVGSEALDPFLFISTSQQLILQN